jgi:hypothetical protein
MNNFKVNFVVILAILILLVGYFIFPKWLVFILTISLTKALIVVGLILLMRVGLVSF